MVISTYHRTRKALSVGRVMAVRAAAMVRAAAVVSAALAHQATILARAAGADSLRRAVRAARLSRQLAARLSAHPRAMRVRRVANQLRASAVAAALLTQRGLVLGAVSLRRLARAAGAAILEGAERGGAAGSKSAGPDAEARAEVARIRALGEPADPYKVLELSTYATPRQVKAAFRKRARLSECTPNRGPEPQSQNARFPGPKPGLCDRARSSSGQVRRRPRRLPHPPGGALHPFRPQGPRRARPLAEE